MRTQGAGLKTKTTGRGKGDVLGAGGRRHWGRGPTPASESAQSVSTLEASEQPGYQATKMKGFISIAQKIFVPQKSFSSKGLNTLTWRKTVNVSPQEPRAHGLCGSKAMRRRLCHGHQSTGHTQTQGAHWAGPWSPCLPSMPSES